MYNVGKECISTTAAFAVMRKLSLKKISREELFKYWYTQMSMIIPVNTPVHVHAVIHYVRDLFEKSTNFKIRLTFKD